MKLSEGATIYHPDFGEGQVRHHFGDTIIARFPDGLKELLARDVEFRNSAELSTELTLSSPLDVTCKALALCCKSVNDSWGIFGRSRIQMLPHQLWVCQRILRSWPSRWLIADDVGLGKTVEAGLAIMALSSRKLTSRVLIVTPASLCNQWQERLLNMFDLRFSIVDGQQAKSSTAWDASNQVITSLHTVRGFVSEGEDETSRLTAMLNAQPWDLVVVDEAHHLNHDESSGMTLAYRLIRSLDREGRIGGMLFFTGTPHRGKDFSFKALLNLLDPDTFQATGSMDDIIPKLPDVMIRNNKQQVTDLEGNRLFKGIQVQSEEYSYSAEEREFYTKMTEFILTGRAYADTLAKSLRSANHLVLTTLQKLASSSIAAVTSTLRKRLALLSGESPKAEPMPQSLLLLTEDPGSSAEISDIANRLTEEVTGRVEKLLVGEKEHIEELLRLSTLVTAETKIERIITRAKAMPENEPLLVFTEFKTTQRALLIRLSQEFGSASTTFLNGDGFLTEIPKALGGPSLSATKEEAARLFNTGKRRFLICTEAGGEGIDLQHRCSTVIHADLPWNPMRLHQRNGRLYRLKQQRDVSVILMRNPETLESRIWSILEDKLQSIQQAYSSAMADPDDIATLVLGMAPPGTYERMHTQNLGSDPRRIGTSIEEAASFISANDAVKAALDIFGHCSRFDFGKSASNLPQIELNDLKPMLEMSLKRHHRNLSKQSDDGLDMYSIITPDEWASQRGVKRRYSNIHFDRSNGSSASMSGLVGFGHPLIDLAISESVDLATTAAIVDDGQDLLALYSVIDQVTENQIRPPIYVGVLISALGAVSIQRDWECIQLMNTLSQRYRTWDTTPPNRTMVLPKSTLNETMPRILELAQGHQPMVKPHATLRLIIQGTLFGTSDIKIIPT